MTSPLQGESRRFESDSAHFFIKPEKILKHLKHQYWHEKANIITNTASFVGNCFC